MLPTEVAASHIGIYWGSFGNVYLFKQIYNNMEVHYSRVLTLKICTLLIPWHLDEVVCETSPRVLDIDNKHSNTILLAASCWTLNLICLNLLNLWLERTLVKLGWTCLVRTWVNALVWLDCLLRTGLTLVTIMAIVNAPTRGQAHLGIHPLSTLRFTDDTL